LQDDLERQACGPPPISPLDFTLENRGDPSVNEEELQHDDQDLEDDQVWDDSQPILVDQVRSQHHEDQQVSLEFIFKQASEIAITHGGW